MSGRGSGARAELPRGTSLYLDFARITAVVLVLLHHVLEPPFHAGGVHVPGRSAVIVFFVISGFVIAYASDGKATGAAMRWRGCRASTRSPCRPSP